MSETDRRYRLLRLGPKGAHQTLQDWIYSSGSVGGSFLFVGQKHLIFRPYGGMVRLPCNGFGAATRRAQRKDRFVMLACSNVHPKISAIAPSRVASGEQATAAPAAARVPLFARCARV